VKAQCRYVARWVRAALTDSPFTRFGGDNY